MGMQRIQFTPGINTQRTATLNKGGWSSSNLIRFREGLPEVKGGWTSFLPPRVINDIGFIESLQWLNNTANPITSLSVTYIVPPAPATNDGQIIYLWAGIESSDAKFLLQPVLQWGNPAGGGGGSFWTLSTYYLSTNLITGQPNPFQATTPVQVTPGTSIQGLVTCTAGTRGQNNFAYTAGFVGYSGTTFNISGIEELNFPIIALEVYPNAASGLPHLASCSDYPNTDFTTMGSIVVNTGTPPSAGSPITPSWQTFVNFTSCGQGIIGSGNSYNFYYRNSSPTLSGQISGAIRQLHAWATLAGTATLGVGATNFLYICQNGVPYEVTPPVAVNTLTNPFTTTVGSSTITVTDATAPAGIAPGNFIQILGSPIVGGVTISNILRAIQTVIGPTQYTISVAPATATSGVTGGGSVQIAYLLTPGQIDTISGTGWGTGTWGQSTWGTPRLVSGTPVGLTAQRTWTIDNWGENMIACARGYGSIYQWVASTGTAIRAAKLANAPTIANGAVVAAPIQMVIAFGCNPPVGGGAADPMLVAWSDQGDNTSWTPLVTNQAGSFRLNNGSQIMQIIPINLQILIWTDTALFGMQYIQPPLVWSFNQLAAACGSISPNAAGVIGGVAIWMSPYEFWMFNGTAQVIDCPLRDSVFKGMNRNQQGKVFCTTNTQWSEVVWHFPSINSTENDSAVTINMDELAKNGPLNCWYGSGVAFGGPPFVRTSGIDDNVFGYPIGGDASGNLWSEEQGNTANGAAMPWSIQSGYVDIADGEDYSFLDLIIPDQILTGGSCAYTVFSIVDPSDMPQQYGPFVVTPDTRFLPNGGQGLRARARAVALRIDNSTMSVGNFWRMGAPRARITRDGRN